MSFRHGLPSNFLPGNRDKTLINSWLKFIMAGKREGKKKFTLARFMEGEAVPLPGAEAACLKTAEADLNGAKRGRHTQK